MQVPHHSIFRDKALKHYMQSQKKDVLPHFNSIPVAIFFWVLLGLLIATGFLAWYVQVPVYLNGSGILPGTGTHSLPGKSKTVALVFFQPDKAHELHAGQAVTIQLSNKGTQPTGVISEIDSGISSPATVQARYGLQIAQPVVVAFIDLGNDFPSTLYANSALVVQVLVRTESLFSALTGIGTTGE